MSDIEKHLAEECTAGYRAGLRDGQRSLEEAFAALSTEIATLRCERDAARVHLEAMTGERNAMASLVATVEQWTDDGNMTDDQVFAAVRAYREVRATKEPT